MFNNERKDAPVGKEFDRLKDTSIVLERAKELYAKKGNTDYTMRDAVKEVLNDLDVSRDVRKTVLKAYPR